MTDASTAIVNQPNAEKNSTPPRRPQYWPGVVLVVAYWLYIGISNLVAMPIYARFLTRVAVTGALILLITLWWLLNLRVRLGERFFAWSALVVATIAGALLAHPSTGIFGILFAALPVAITAWLGWSIVSRTWSTPLRRLGMIVVLAIALVPYLVTRSNGIWGEGSPELAWRWSTTAEDEYLAERAKRTNADSAAAGETLTSKTPLSLGPGDWPEFRGPGRIGEYRGPAIAANWSASPPHEVWRRHIGPAWSSLLVIGDYLFTQEQRGEEEAVVALDTATGRERWSHVDKTRFFDGQGGAGPRATPTFAAGKIYSLGATGILNCLDAATGALDWSQNIATDSGAAAPMWGFSSSPLVADGVVIVYAGGETGKELLGYDAATGSQRWTAASGPISYSSGQAMTHNGHTLVLFLSDRGLIAIEPSTGKVAGEYLANTANMWRAAQPRPLDDGGILFGSEDLGLVLINAIGDGPSTAAPRWTSKVMKPAFNDFVILDGSIYGFDDAVFECVELATGKRRWRGGRYGHGQVLLLVEQKLLLVISETGEAVLVAARPDKLEELGRFQAVTGKTWNHPTIAHGQLFVRNDEEIACFDVSSPAPTQ